MRFVRVAVVLFLLACGDGGGSTPTAPTTPTTPTPVATSITLSATSLSFSLIGATQQLSATVKDQSGATMSGASVSWATSNPSIASVSSAGLVTALTDGTATITATVGSLQATATVSVAQEAAIIELSPPNLFFSSVGDTATFTATVQDQNGVPIAGTTVAWASSDTGVATVSDEGLVTAIANGTATITATVGSLQATATASVAQEAASIELSPTVLTFLIYGDTATIVATVKDAGGNTIPGPTVTWATTTSIYF